MKITIVVGIVFLVILLSSTTILTNDAFSQTPNQPLPPRQQWKNMDDVSQVTCREGLVLLEKTTGAPACVSPNAYLRLIDRGWGMWDPTIMSNRQNMMQGVMSQIIRDPNMSQQLHTMIQQKPNLWYDSPNQLRQQIQQYPDSFQNIMIPMMNDPQLRQQMIEMMQQNQQMMQSIQSNNIMMGMIRGNIPLPLNQTTTMGGGEEGQNTMGQGGMMMRGPMMGQGMMMHNPQVMQGLMNQMLNDPQMGAAMRGMMIQNPYHMESMMMPMNQGMVGHMFSPMMNDPELRQQMLDLMVQHRDMMMELRQNQQFMNSLNQQQQQQQQP